VHTADMFDNSADVRRGRWSLPTLRAATDTAVDLVFPSRCAACHGEGGPCCATCRRVWGRAFRRYPPLLPSTPAYVLAFHRGTARELVLQHKERGRRDLARPLGDALARGLAEMPEVSAGDTTCWWLVPAPSRRSAARVRGGSHTRALASRCAWQLARRGQAAAVAPALRLRGNGGDMAGLDREQRVCNLAGRMVTLRDGMPPVGSSVVLLDDVLTTGATAAAAVTALCGAGCGVRAVVTLTGAC